MHVLVSTENMPHEEWLSWRKRGLGGSDAATACGLNPYKSPVELWLEKTGQTVDSHTSEAAYWGNTLEPIIRKEFQKRTGLKVKEVKAILQHEDIPFMLADIDGMIDHGGNSYIFEAKTATAYKSSQWEDGSVPYAYQLQIQHYMAVTGACGAYIAALIGGNRFISVYVPRDEELISMLIGLEAKFWKYVKSNIQPPVDGSDACTNLINKLYPISTKKEINLSDEFMPTILAYENACALESEALFQKNEAANILKELLKDHETGRIGERFVRWKCVNSKRLDSKSLKSDHPDLYEQYLKESSSRRFQIF